jgi:hypothetical protein
MVTTIAAQCNHWQLGIYCSTGTGDIFSELHAAINCSAMLLATSIATMATVIAALQATSILPCWRRRLQRGHCSTCSGDVHCIILHCKSIAALLAGEIKFITALCSDR